MQLTRAHRALRARRARAVLCLSSALVPACGGEPDAPLGVAELRLTYTLSPESGDGSCSSDFTFNGIDLKGPPSADWCQIQQAVNALKAAGTGGTIELANKGQAYRITGPILLNTDDITIVGLPDGGGNKPEIDFDPPPCTYNTRPSPSDPSILIGYCEEDDELNYSALTVNDQTAGCAKALDGKYCPRERVIIRGLVVNVRRGLAGPPTTSAPATHPTLGSQSVIMLMNCGDCRVEETDLVPAYVAGARGVSQDGITFGPGSTGYLGSTGATGASVVDIAKAGVYLTPLSGIHVDAHGAIDNAGVLVDNVSVSKCGGGVSWGSGVSIAGNGGALSNCTVAYNEASGVFMAPQPLGPADVAASWVAARSTRITDCDIHHNKGQGVLIGSSASAYGIDAVTEDTVITRISAHDNIPYDGIRIEAGRRVTIVDGTFYRNSAGITLANQSHIDTSTTPHQRRIDGMTSDIAISGAIFFGNTYYGLLLLAVNDVSVTDSLLYDPAASSSPAVGEGMGLWGSHIDSNTYVNSGIALNELNIGENGMSIYGDGEAVSGIYSLTGEAGPTNRSGNPNTYSDGVGLYAPKGSTYVDSTNGVTYWKSTGPTDPQGWVTTGPRKIVAGSEHTCALLAEGTVQCWGYNLSGQLGLGAGSPTTVYAPIEVSSLSGIVDIAAGSYHTCALNHDGEVYCWGDNHFGEIGDGTSTGRPSPVLALTGAVAVSAGGQTSCAILTDHTARCWGMNWQGQVGAGYTSAPGVPWPTPVQGIAHASAIAVGSSHACALLANGSVKCWGDDHDGELGDGPAHAPLSVTPMTPIAEGSATLAAGLHFTCASTMGGAILCWGRGESGQIGNGSFTRQSKPTAVSNATGAIQVGDTRWAHACAILSGGDAYCWGDNEAGALGDGTTTSRATIGATPVVQSVSSISAGNNHTCAFLSSGAVQCWGSNRFGQIGQPSTTTDSLLPSNVTLAAP
ncbi:right-handed parallel beta-helix repeat-containing protein [Sorangium sp. So ce1000]|uniref:right-handed parallel beta-helix repeat-containing protein n=1 Tax=Sorangium sp. So ce1000 TaxID=3133325 RepID=UPI003F5E30EE